MALTSQVFIQPTVTAGPASPMFWAFWISHTLVLGCAVHDVAVLRLRPDRRDLGRVHMSSAAYFALVFRLNIWLGRPKAEGAATPAESTP